MHCCGRGSETEVLTCAVLTYHHLINTYYSYRVLQDQFQARATPLRTRTPAGLSPTYSESASLDQLLVWKRGPKVGVKVY